MLFHKMLEIKTQNSKQTDVDEIIEHYNKTKNILSNRKIIIAGKYLTVTKIDQENVMCNMIEYIHNVITFAEINEQLHCYKIV